MTITSLKIFDRKSYEAPKDELTLARERLAEYHKELELLSTQEELSAMTAFRNDKKPKDSESMIIGRGNAGGSSGFAPELAAADSNIDNLSQEIEKRQIAKQKAKGEPPPPPEAETKIADVVEQTC